MIIRINPAKYFAKTIFISVKGLVNKNSIVPDFLSSENNRIVIAGTRNKYTHGVNVNKLSGVAYSESRIFIPEPGNIHKNILIKPKKTIIATDFH